MARALASACCVLALIFLTGAGCPFEPRDAVPPETTGTIPPECQFSGAVSPAASLRNLEQAFACVSDGLGMFRSSLAPAFDFNASEVEDPQIRDFVDAWEDLSIPREGPIQQFTQHMGGLEAEDTVAFTLGASEGDEVSANDGTDGVKFENVGYELVFSRGGAAFARFEGDADVFVRLVGGDFAIYRWDDLNQGFPTLAEFWFSGTGTAGGG